MDSQSLMNTINVLQKQIEELKIEVKRLSELGQPQRGPAKYDSIEVNDLVINGSIRMGQGDIAMHGDYQGWWWGQNRLATIVGGATGVAILMDGTFYQNP